MKKTIVFFLSVLISLSAWSQNDLKRVSTPKGFNYKALVSENGTPVANSIINVKVKLKDGATELWYEEHTNVHTDANGIFSINIGEGTRISGSYTNFSYFNWNTYDDVKMDVEIDTGSGYQTLVSNEALKYVPYAKNADRSSSALQAHHLLPQTDEGIQLITTTNTITNGYRLTRGTDDWYIYLNNSDFVIRNDATDVMKIKDATNTIYMLKPLEVSNSGIVFDTNASGTGNHYFINGSDGLQFKYNTATAMKLHGSASLELMGKLRAPTSGNNDMKAYAYGEWYAGSARHISDNVSITRLSTGHYKITFNPAVGSTDDYIVIANRYLDTGFVKISKSGAFFYLDTYNASNNPVDGNFTFVVYKK